MKLSSGSARLSARNRRRGGNLARIRRPPPGVLEDARPGACRRETGWEDRPEPEILFATRFVTMRCHLVVLAAGRGARMRTRRPKALHGLAGFSMLDHVVQAATPAESGQTLVVVSPAIVSELGIRPDMQPDERSDRPPVTYVVQEQPMGTGDAVREALTRMGDLPDTDFLLIAMADTPLIQPASFEKLKQAVLTPGTPGTPGPCRDFACLGFYAEPGTAYGRLVLDAQERLLGIVEAGEAEEQKKRQKPFLAYAGAMAAPLGLMRQWVCALNTQNPQNEYRLTDGVSWAVQNGRQGTLVEIDAQEGLGVNDLAALAQAETWLQHRYRASFLEQGVSMADPASCYFSRDTRIGVDSRLEPHVWLGPGCAIGQRVLLRAFSHLEGTTIGDDACVGPFARLRPGTVLRGGNKIGNFVEVKNTTLHDAAQASHLTYLGDTEIGTRTNIGAGVITCNYDGSQKHRTTLGDDVFVGSNCSLIAPLTVGSGAVVGAGSVVHKTVKPGDLAVSRPPLQTWPDGGTRFHRVRKTRRLKQKLKQKKE